MLRDKICKAHFGVWLERNLTKCVWLFWG